MLIRHDYTFENLQSSLFTEVGGNAPEMCLKFALPWKETWQVWSEWLSKFGRTKD